jgi:3',5'-cyclic AMP phosphodiesterase CpdA
VTKTILHLSDLHFGWPLRPAVASQLLKEAHALAPDLVILSGDLTQRGLPHQFIAARRWLDGLARPLLVVPGNHDVPLFNPVLRFSAPLKRYQQHIAEDSEPVFQDESLLVIGLSSARGRTIQDGWLLPPQLARARALIASRQPGQAVVVVVHHHFLSPPGAHQKTILNAPELLRTFDQWGVDVVLVGHTHQAWVQRTAGGLLLIQAGTATSRRGKGTDRGQNNYHLIATDDCRLEVVRQQYCPAEGRFVESWRGTFERRSIQHPALSQEPVGKEPVSQKAIT